MSTSHHYYTVPLSTVNPILLRNAESEITRLRFNSQYLWIFPTFPNDEYAAELSDLQSRTAAIKYRLARPRLPFDFWTGSIIKFKLNRILRRVKLLHEDVEEFRATGDVAKMLPTTWIERTPRWDPASIFYDG